MQREYKLVQHQRWCGVSSWPSSADWLSVVWRLGTDCWDWAAGSGESGPFPARSELQCCGGSHTPNLKRPSSPGKWEKVTHKWKSKMYATKMSKTSWNNLIGRPQIFTRGETHTHLIMFVYEGLLEEGEGHQSPPQTLFWGWNNTLGPRCPQARHQSTEFTPAAWSTEQKIKAVLTQRFYIS